MEVRRHAYFRDCEILHQLLPPLPALLRKRAHHALHRLFTLLLRLGIQQVPQRLHLQKGHSSVHKRALCKLARFRRSKRRYLGQRLEHRLHNGRTPVQMKLRHVLSRIARMEGRNDHYLDPSWKQRTSPRSISSLDCESRILRNEALRISGKGLALFVIAFTA